MAQTTDQSDEEDKSSYDQLALFTYILMICLGSERLSSMIVGLILGLIKDADSDSLKVEVMNQIGSNRFFRPLRADATWYEYEDVISLVPEPTLVLKPSRIKTTV